MRINTSNMSVYNFHDICEDVFEINWYFGWCNTFALTLIVYNTFALNNKYGCFSVKVIHTRAYCKVNFGLYIYGGKPAANETFFCPPTVHDF